MEGYGAETFGALNADDYDVRHDPGTTDLAVAALRELIGTGTALEFAIGTGRVALPLARAGVPLEGIEASPEMVAKLRGKPGGETIPLVLGDMATAVTGKTYDVVFLIFNTLFNLIRQDDQIRCCENAARHLNPGGRFIVEAFVPDLSRFNDGQSVRARSVDFGSATLEAAVHDPVTQVVDYQYIRITADGVRLVPLPMRYAWPSEIDLMARLAGLSLEARWGSWDRTPFTANSVQHISVYRKSQSPAGMPITS